MNCSGGFISPSTPFFGLDDPAHNPSNERRRRGYHFASRSEPLIPARLWSVFGTSADNPSLREYHPASVRTPSQVLVNFLRQIHSVIENTVTTFGG